MPAPKTDIVGKFTGSYASIGRDFRAQGQVYNGIGRAVENLLDSMNYAAETYINEKSKETPEQRLFKIEKEREINQRIAEDGAIYRYKPDEFLEQSRKSKETFLKDIPEENWDWANETYEQTISRYHSAITNNKLALNRQQQLAGFTSQGQDFENKAMTAAANGDAAAFAEYSLKWRENEEYLFNNGFINGDTKARRALDFTNKGVIQQNLAAAKQLFNNPEQLNSFIKNIDNSKNYSPIQKQNIKNSISSEYSSWQALNKVQAADNIKTADFGIEAYSMGLEPKNFDFDKTFANLKASGQTEKAEQLKNAYLLKNETEGFAKLSLQQMSEEISKLKETAENSEDLNKIKLLEKLANVAEKEINNDPLYYAEQHGVIETEILDITKPENFNKRLKNAAFLQEKYGLDYMPVIKKNEAEALKKAISGMNSEAKALTLAQINTAFGEESGQVFEAIAPDNPEFAVAGKIFRNNPEAAVNIISGMDIAANEKGFAPTQNVNLQNAFGRLDQALSNFAPEDIGAVKKAIVANMTYINKKNNLFASGDVIDSDKTLSADEAIENVLGGKIIKMSVGDGWFGGSYYTVLPANTDKSDFEDWFFNLKDSDVGEVYVNGQRIRAESIANDGTLNYDDNNRYTVTIDGDFVRHADGTPLILTYGGKQ